jgi:hypothetical protein
MRVVIVVVVEIVLTVTDTDPFVSKVVGVYIVDLLVKGKFVVIVVRVDMIEDGTVVIVSAVD